MRSITIDLVEDSQIDAMIDNEYIHAHRERALNPENPFIRGTAQNPDIYFQGARDSQSLLRGGARASSNPTWIALPSSPDANMSLCAYHGAPDAERLIVILGSAGNVVKETLEDLAGSGDDKLGVLKIHLYRPFPEAELVAKIPASVKSIAVLDRTKEPGSGGEPPIQGRHDCGGASPYRGQPFIVKNYRTSSAAVTGSRRKISRRRWQRACFDELKKERPKNNFTVGIIDDVTHTSIDYDPNYIIDLPGVYSAMFYGQGGDGTVGSNKNTVQIIGQQTDYEAQAYFYYDSKKAGSETISHLPLWTQ